MYVVDGIAYAGEPVAGIEVASARYVGNSILLVIFSTGEVHLFDVTCLLHMPVFKPLEDETVVQDFKVELESLHGAMARLISRLRPCMNGVMSINRLPKGKHPLHAHSVQFPRSA